MTLRTLADGRVFAEVSGGGGTLVVLLHGWGRNRSDLLPVAAGLSGTVASLDLPGFGTAPPPPEAWGAREYAPLVAEAVEELLDEDPRPVLLVGHSFGGRVAVCLGAKEAWVSGLVLTGVPLIRKAGFKPALQFRIVRALNRRGILSDERMEAMRQKYGSEDYRRAQGVMRDTVVRSLAESYEDELARITCPVRFVWGSLDTAAPVAMARAAADLVPGPHEFVELEGVGHDVHHVQPEVLRTAIEQLT